MKRINTSATPFLLVLFLLTAPMVFSQPPKGGPKGKREKIEQLKIAFFTKELDMTSEQAEQFWPVYNELNKKVREKKKENRQLSNELRENKETLSESDFKTKTTKVLDNDVEIAKLKKEYVEKIADIIGYKKATKLLSLEARFKRELLNQLSEPEKPTTSEETD